MNGIVHPFSGALCEQDGNGGVRVVQKDGLDPCRYQNRSVTNLVRSLVLASVRSGR
jgi:hypothetical protein